MTDLPSKMTVGDLTAALAPHDPATTVAVDTGDILENPMPGIPVDGGPAELTVMNLPAMPGETQTVADITALLTLDARDANGLGPDSLFVLAPLDGPARVVTEVQHSPVGLTLLTAPLS